MKQSKNGLLTAIGALGGRRAGLGVMLRRCACEVKSYKLKPLPKADAAQSNTDEYEPKISAIVCTYNRQDKLVRAVSSLMNQTLSRDKYEIIVVNNGGELNAETEVKIDGVRIINEPKPGLTYARNTGADAAKGKFLTYIDDDAIAEPNMLEAILNAFFSHKKAGIIGGQIWLSPPKHGIVLKGHEDLWSEFRIPGKKYREVSRQYEFPFGANFSVRHSMLDEAGGFDERYGRTGSDYAGGEETALCFKALSLGYKIGLEPNSVVWHDVDESRFTREHIRRTMAAGIFTTCRLYKDGYSRSAWDRNYALERVKIAETEIEKLRRCGADELEIFYKECERDGFSELARSLEKE